MVREAPLQQPADTGEQRLTMTYAEFCAWADEDVHAEWVAGEVTIFMAPKTAHQIVISFLLQVIGLFVNLFDLGAVYVAPLSMRALPGGSVREPDLLFLTNEHLDRRTEDRLEGVADLVIEVISQESVYRDRVDKFDEYETAGVREYWIIDPRPGRLRADFYQLTAEGRYQAVLPDAEGRYHSAILSGFWLRPDLLWHNPMPDPLTVLSDIPAVRHALRQRIGTD